jgi:hypothetical protein
MADVTTDQTLQDGDRIAVVKLINISDGTGYDDTVVEVSTLQAQSGSGAACTGVTIECVWYECNGMAVDILWHATTPLIAWTLSGYGYFDFRSAGPLINNAGSGKTGDINFRTIGHSAGDRYTVMLKLSKSYG